MKKLFVLLLCAAAFASCGIQRIIPRAVNTVNTAPLSDLNLTRADYEILNTIESEATVFYKRSGKKMEVSGDDFSLRYTLLAGGRWRVQHSGILLQGYLHGDHITDGTAAIDPEGVVRRLAIYRLINIAKQSGGDAVIEPTVATSVEQTDMNTIVYKTITTAKVIKIKTDR